MRKMLVAAFTAVLTIGLAPAAEAHPTYHYHGGCEVSYVRTAGGISATEYSAAVVATAAGNDLPAAVFITVDCQVYSNGFYWGTPVSASGFMAAADTTVLSWGSLNGLTDMCTVVTVAFSETHIDCQPL